MAHSHWRSAHIPRRPCAGGALYAEAGGVRSQPPLGAGSRRSGSDLRPFLLSPRALRGCPDSYLFHYICQDRIVYLCITDDDFERSRAFNFLNEIKKRFQTTYGSRAQTALPYAMNSEFSSVLAAQLKHHSENKGIDKVVETQAQVDELKGIMVRNIDLVAQRGERLELLIDKTENLVDSSVTFKTTSRNLARAMCMKNLKLTIIIIIVSIVFIYIIVSPLCGGFTWPSCVKK
uniref:AP-3 complex subunit delta-1 n=1 Tax=Ailuropoda melanoleuca TaxID=9646 RepID=A0A7N5KKW3_AILME